MSQHFILTLVLLAVVGGADMVSVVIRQTLVQSETPDRLRGRVSAVNTLFIGASNEISGQIRRARLARGRSPRRGRRRPEYDRDRGPMVAVVPGLRDRDKLVRPGPGQS